MKINFDIWWQRIIIVFIIALVISVAMFIINEKPFTPEGQSGIPASEDNHEHPPGTPTHED